MFEFRPPPSLLRFQHFFLNSPTDELKLQTERTSCAPLHLCSVRAQECTAVCADLLTLLSRIPPSGGNVFVIIMPRFTVRQGNSITGMRTGPAFVRLRLEPQAAVAVPPLFLSLAPTASFSLPPALPPAPPPPCVLQVL